MDNLFFNDPRELRIVVIDKPMYHLDDPFVRDIIAKMIKLKVDSYQTTTSNYFAFDKTDLMATHFLAGVFKNKEFIPLIGIKCVSLNESIKRQVVFPGKSVVQSVFQKKYQHAVDRFITTTFDAYGDVGYIGSLAMENRVQSKFERIELLKILNSMGARYNFFKSFKASICIARVKTNSPSVISRIGFKPLTLNQSELPSIRIPDFINDEFLLMKMEKISIEGQGLIHEYDQHWKSKIIFSVDDSDCIQQHTMMFEPLHETKKAA